MATHPSILAWRIPWTEEPGGLQSMGCRELGTTYQLNNNKITAPIRTTAVCSPAEAPVWVGAGGCLSQLGVSLLAPPSQPTDTSSLSPLGSEED